jgi:protein-disulfide isomerase
VLGWAAVGLMLAGCGSAAPSSATRPAPAGAASLAARFGGIPQRGPVLGSPRAPYTLFWFADLQCPFCAAFDRDVLPAVISRFVRPGRLRLELRPIAFIGPGSAVGAAATVAAGLQDRMWQFADLFYRNQERENSGYVTPQFVAWIALGVPGLNLSTMRRTSGTRPLIAQLEQNAGLARAAYITATPSFRLGRTSGVLLAFYAGAVTRQRFLSKLEAVIGKGGAGSG